MAIRLSLAAPLRGAKRWNFLDRAHTIHVATQFGDDPIYLAALWFVVHEETIYLPLDQASKHMHNIERGGRLSAVVDEGHSIADVRGIHVEGHARKVDDREFAEELEEMVLQKYFYEGDPYLEEYVNFGQYNDRTFWEVIPDKMWGFDLREISNMATSEKRVLPDHMLGDNGKS
jgi:nitroimidazol reductase NimA-like FMN-containing flavoprotein (pyridoxamine 5'-phosphate oxidase superfamily)